MRFQLVPSLLAQQHIEYDDVHHKLIVNQHLIPLSVTQYRLVTALLQQRQRWQDSQGREPLILSIPHLLQAAQLTNRQLIKYHLCLASARLESQGLVVVNVHGFGYAIFARSEIGDVA